MEKSKVYFTDFRSRPGDPLTNKLRNADDYGRNQETLILMGSSLPSRCILANWATFLIFVPITRKRLPIWSKN
jgi:hypothetical protein